MGHSANKQLRSIGITCEIIDTLKGTDGYGVTELSNRLGHAKSTIHDHLKTLEENRLIIKKGEKYRLSVHLLGIGEHVRDQFDNYDVIRNSIDGLAMETGETVQFGIEEHGRVYYLYKNIGAQGVETISKVGKPQSMHSSSLGKAIMAHLSEERVNEIIDKHGLPAKTANTITTRERLFEELEKTRERGYAVDREENLNGITCIGDSVLSDEGVFGAVSVTGPSSRLHDKRIEDELVEKLQSTADVIAINSKYG